MATNDYHVAKFHCPYLNTTTFIVILDQSLLPEIDNILLAFMTYSLGFPPFSNYLQWVLPLC